MAKKKSSKIDRFGSPASSSYFPETPLQSEAMEALLSNQVIANQRLVDFTRVILVGTAGAAIVIFNASISILGLKIFEAGIPLDIQAELLVLYSTLLISFVAAFSTYYHAALIGERISHIRVVLDHFEEKYSESRKLLMDAVDAGQRTFLVTGFFFLAALLAAGALVFSLVVIHAGSPPADKPKQAKQAILSRLDSTETTLQHLGIAADKLSYIFS